jgi:hypothetical protein
MRTTLATILAGSLALAACDGGPLGGGGADDGELVAGTRIAATATSTVTSETNAVGDELTARVSSDVADSSGTVVIPAGSEIRLRIASIAPGPNKGDRGVLTFDVVGITVGEESHGLEARVVDYAYEMKGTGVGGAEVAKTAAGGAAGAIIGAVAGDKEVIGGVAGAAAGAAVADYTQDRHIVVAAGNRIDLELTGEFDG